MKNKKSVYPYDAKIMFGSNITGQETRRINTCNGKLPNCEKPYHCPYLNCGEYKNKVTMIRNPYKWLPSYAHWMWKDLAPGRKSSLETSLPFQSQMSFIANTNNVDEAINILQNNYSWWGISDYWETSVCTFHCKFGGIPQILSCTTHGQLQVMKGLNPLLLKIYDSKFPLWKSLSPIWRSVLTFITGVMWYYTQHCWSCFGNELICVDVEKGVFESIVVQALSNSIFICVVSREKEKASSRSNFMQVMRAVCQCHPGKSKRAAMDIKWATGISIVLVDGGRE